jgi:hypothetical protein
MVIVRKFSRFFFGFLRDILVVKGLTLVEEMTLTEFKTKFFTAMTMTIIIIIMVKIQLFIINVPTQSDVTGTRNN